MAAVPESVAGAGPIVQVSAAQPPAAQTPAAQAPTAQAPAGQPVQTPAGPTPVAAGPAPAGSSLAIPGPPPVITRGVSLRAPAEATIIKKRITTLFEAEEKSRPEELATSTFALPDTSKFSQDFKDYLRQDLVDGVIEAVLERFQVINWNDKLPHLTPLLTNAKGNCLLDGACLAMWGVQDADMLLRKQVQVCLSSDIGTRIQARYKGPKSDLAKLVEQVSLPADGDKDKPGKTEFLEQIHIFALAHVLKRPIIVYADRHDRTDEGGVLSTLEGGQRMDGIYLPLELTTPPPSPSSTPVLIHTTGAVTTTTESGVQGDPRAQAESPENGAAQAAAQAAARSRRSPIALAYANRHFTALVGTVGWEQVGLGDFHMTSPPPKQPPEQKEEKKDEIKDIVMKDVNEAKEGKEGAETKEAEIRVEHKEVWYPLVDMRGERLPVHFLVPNEDADYHLQFWLDCFDIPMQPPVRAARVPAGSVRTGSNLLKEYLTSAHSHLSGMSQQGLDEFLRRSKKCLDCTKVGVFKGGRCVSCSIRFSTPVLEVTGAPIGQGPVRGFYICKSKTGPGGAYPMYEKVGGKQKMFLFWWEELKRWQFGGHPEGDGCNVYSDGAPVLSPEKVLGWKFYIGSAFMETPNTFKVATCAALPQKKVREKAIATGNCRNSPKCGFSGTDKNEGYCSGCYGSLVFGVMVTSGAPMNQRDVEGEYVFYKMTEDDEGESRPAFKKTYGDFYLYYLNGEWCFGKLCEGLDRNIIVSAGGPELPHAVTDKWSAWAGAWVPSQTFKVLQRLPQERLIPLEKRPEVVVTPAGPEHNAMEDDPHRRAGSPPRDQKTPVKAPERIPGASPAPSPLPVASPQRPMPAPGQALCSQCQQIISSAHKNGGLCEDCALAAALSFSGDNACPKCLRPLPMCGCNRGAVL